MDLEMLLSELTLEEKAALVSGTNNMYTNPVPRLGIPSLSMADGPHGLRKQLGGLMDGIADAAPSTAFPTAVATASGWNPENLYKMGAAIGRECRHYGVHILLGPGVNIKRNPLCGRNFEYFSEDPLLSGTMGTAMVRGVKSQDVDVSVKHFALNSNENYRYMGNSVADLRTIREIYLKAFETIVKEAQPATLMCAYNQILGEFCSENPWLLTKVLREEWGFPGLVMTDWGAARDRVKGIEAGLDLEMPGDTAICRKWIVDGVKNGSLSEESLDRAVSRVLRLVDRYVTDKDLPEVFWEDHHALSAEIAADCAVLLKNDGTLPLKENTPLLVIGELFEKMRYQGAGSSMIHATKVVSPMDAFCARSAEFTYCPGYQATGTAPELILQAVDAAENAGTVVVFLGLTDEIETEGGDRPHMRLPENQLRLMEALKEAGVKPVVVLFGGSVVELPFADDVTAILHMFLPGQNGGSAVYDLLFGHRNPAGRLAETWPLHYGDVPFGAEYACSPRDVYKEGIFVGYRYYETAQKPVRYSFGYGLSYTSFQWSDMTLQQENSAITVTCRITNTGACAGADVVQLYVSGPGEQAFRPVRELRGFQKVYLQAGESRIVSLPLSTDDLRYFHPSLDRWVLEPGRYTFSLCRDAHTVCLSTVVSLAGEDVPAPYSKKVMEVYGIAALDRVTEELFEEMSGRKLPSLPPALPIHMESRFTDFKLTFFGSIIYRAVLFYADHQIYAAEKLPLGAERDNQIKGAQFFRRAIETNSLRSMSMAAGNTLPYNLAQGLMELANGHLLRGIRCCLKRIDAPPLPKDGAVSH